MPHHLTDDRQVQRQHRKHYDFMLTNMIQMCWDCVCVSYVGSVFIIMSAECVNPSAVISTFGRGDSCRNHLDQIDRQRVNTDCCYLLTSLCKQPLIMFTVPVAAYSRGLTTVCLTAWVFLAEINRVNISGIVLCNACSRMWNTGKSTHGKISIFPASKNYHFCI